MSSEFFPLYGRLRYTFQNESLVRMALSHRSLSQHNNERLEFLGDAVLNIIISTELYRRFPTALEGQLSRLRAQLVDKKSLVELAKGLGISDFIRLGEGELKSGGRQRESILADALEALMGAIYQDSHLEACAQVVLHWYEKRVECLSLEEVTKDPKTTLQEWTHAKKVPLPTYELLSVSGHSPNQLFSVCCYIEGISQKCQGVGESRREAEQLAAEQLLSLLEGWESE